MKIQYVTGDLIAAEEACIVHGCNAQGAYASGVAGVIRKRYPFAYDAYRAAFDDPTSDFSLGSVVWGFDIAPNRPARIVGNMITQENYGRDATRRYVSYDAIRRAFHKVDAFVRLTQDGTCVVQTVGTIKRIGMPLVGCGLGGGTWREVSQIIEEESHNFVPVVYTLDGVIPN